MVLGSKQLPAAVLSTLEEAQVEVMENAGDKLGIRKTQASGPQASRMQGGAETGQSEPCRDGIWTNTRWLPHTLY